MYQRAPWHILATSLGMRALGPLLGGSWVVFSSAISTYSYNRFTPYSGTDTPT